MRSRGRRHSFIVVPALGVLSACTEFADGNDVLLAEAAMLTDDPAEPGQDWSCLGEGALPMPTLLLADPESANRLVASVRLLSLSSGSVVPGVSVHACEQRDVNCESPITEDFVVDAQGWVDLPLYEGFFGYFEARSARTIPAVIFLSGPLTVEGRVDNVPFALVENEVLPAFGQVTGNRPDPERGVVWLRAFDCRGDSAPGISFSIDRDGPSWYFVGSLPSVTVTSTAETGLGGFFNVPPGVAVVDASTSGRSLAGSKSLLVRAGWVSGMRIVPDAAAP